MPKALTAMAVRSFRPTAQRRELRDGACPGLYVVIQVSGHKSFALRFRRPDGRAGKLTLGPFDPSAEAQGEPVIGAPLTLAAARALASSLHRDRARGQDIIAERATRATVTGDTYLEAVRDFIERHARPRTRSWRDTARTLGLTPELTPIKGGLAERWGARPVTAIDSDTVHAAIEAARRAGIPGQVARMSGPRDTRALRLFAALSSLFGWLHRQRRVKVNPCAGVPRPAAAAARDRVLTGLEVQKFWQAAAAERRLGPLLKLLLLTGCRLNEVAGMRRSELSADLATWTIPGARTKNGKALTVPLPPLARELLASVPDLGSDLMFTNNGAVPVNDWAKVKRRLDARMMVLPWRLHDLRRSAVTHMAELGIRPDVIELVVNHSSGHRAGIAGTYNRSELMPERRAALEIWTARVIALAGGVP